MTTPHATARLTPLNTNDRQHVAHHVLEHALELRNELRNEPDPIAAHAISDEIEALLGLRTRLLDTNDTLEHIPVRHIVLAIKTLDAEAKRLNELATTITEQLAHANATINGW